MSQITVGDILLCDGEWEELPDGEESAVEFSTLSDADLALLKAAKAKLYAKVSSRVVDEGCVARLSFYYQFAEDGSRPVFEVDLDEGQACAISSALDTVRNFQG